MFGELRIVQWSEAFLYCSKINQKALNKSKSCEQDQHINNQFFQNAFLKHKIRSSEGLDMLENSIQNQSLENGDFNSLAKLRYSCRSFAQKAIPSQDLKQILEAACLAPSAMNSQSCMLHLVKDPEVLKNIGDVRDWRGAQAIIVVCVPHNGSFTRTQDCLNYTLVDLGILLDHMALSATSLGLGSCIMASFDPNAMRVALQIPMEFSPVVALALGYPDENGGPGDGHFSRLSVEQRLLPNSDHV